jgi:ABC-type dipeptide/oligopeptide/nickel transport system permease subunit
VTADVAPRGPSEAGIEAARPVVIPARPPSLAQRFVRHRGAVIGLTILVVIVMVALAGPWLAPYNPYLSYPDQTLQPPQSAHLFGTDDLGRDVAMRMLHGAYLSLAMGFYAVALAVFFGLLLGLPAGYFGGATDMIVMRVMDVMLAFPSILLALSVVSILGPSLANAMVAVSVSVVPVYVRLVRASALQTRELLFVESAHVMGVGHVAIMVRHLLPNVLAPLVVVATLGVATAIIVGASLSFLGLGAQPPTPEWGAMLNDGRGFIRTAWWLTVFPGIAIMVTVLAINLIGDGLRDMLDPRMRV